MKRFFVLLLFLAISFPAFSQRGRMQIGAILNFPAFKTVNTTSFVLGIEANYLLESTNGFKYGSSIAVDYYINKNGLEGFIYLPVAFAARFAYSNEFTIGADVGFGIGLAPKGISSGFYYKPMLGYAIHRNIQLTVSIAVVSIINASVSKYGVGILFSL